VESEGVAAHLKKLGVRYGQGFLFGRAQPLEDTLVELLSAEWVAPAAASG
jgi:EAL domain-containing protein (putative c-di-GMP-specific phosphodiesterase class I)